MASVTSGDETGATYVFIVYAEAATHTLTTPLMAG